MKRLNKVLILILSAFTVRFILSCCNCNNAIEPFNITDAKIFLIDNSGVYPVPANDTLIKSAIAFEIWLGNNQIEEFVCIPKNINVFLDAKACDCISYYELETSLDSIAIFNNSNINFLFPANTNLSEYFYATKVNSDNPNGLYQSLGGLVDEINNTMLGNSMVYKFQTVMENLHPSGDTLTFDFTFYFANGAKLVTKSPIIYLKN